jgi:hypothetical protein
VYQNQFYPVQLLTPMKNPNENEKLINNKISMQRGAIEKVFGLIKIRFDSMLFNFRWPIRFFMVCFRLACVAINHIEGELTEDELNQIRIINTENDENNEYEQFDLRENNISLTFPEVLINNDNSHSINLISDIERSNWSGRNRTRNPIQSNT